MDSGLKTEVKTEVTRLACVGDSITFGAAIWNRKNNCYPKQLAELLGSLYKVGNFGVNGATMLTKGDKPYITLKAYKDALAFEANIVVIKLGTNDIKPQNWAYKSEYISDYVQMINIFKELKSKPKVYICYPVPVYEECSGIYDSTLVNEVIPMVTQIAAKTEAEIIDLYKALSGKKEMFPDCVHPNKKGATAIARTVYEAIMGRQAKIA